MAKNWAKEQGATSAAIVIKNTFLSNTDNASVALRKMLLARCELEWVLDLPQKVFAAGVHTVVLFFRKGKETKKPIDSYQLDLKGVSLGKTRPLTEDDLAEFEKLAKGGGDAEGRSLRQDSRAAKRLGKPLRQDSRGAKREVGLAGRFTGRPRGRRWFLDDTACGVKKERI